ncbi:cyclin-dependent kinase inhibitor 7-like [Rutidosis leptorrhynchoides]|uniref:cyclin-dependent kinase inhibitor 7-like n=1 Tax=Rutidosis leptorrhynchoides TaxID=125765 RepID=UPI003A992850
MIEETRTSGYEITESVPVMEVSNSNGIIRRNIDTEITISGTGKRRRFDSQNQENVVHLQCHSVCDIDENCEKKVKSHHVSSSFLFSINHNSISDLKSACISEAETLISTNDGFRATFESSVVSLESEEIESANEVTSLREPSPEPAKMPSAAELEEFFSEAEKYEQKRFAEKYNFDIVKDVPIEGRYQWIRLKP